MVTVNNIQFHNTYLRLTAIYHRTASAHESLTIWLRRLQSASKFKDLYSNMYDWYVVYLTDLKKKMGITHN